MSHKLEFIEKASAMPANISALCREYGISRQTGHKWLRRFRAQGYTGLVEQSRRPLSSPLTTGEEIVVRSRGRGGLSQLSAWLVSLGIRVVRSRPGCPQDNGGHERMHRDLSELELNPARTRRAQQRACDRWMIEFNEVRPHHALGGKTPAEVYRDPEHRSLDPLVPRYPPEWKTRLVSKKGTISVNDDVVFVGTALAGQIVGLKHEGISRWRAHFFAVDLGMIEIAPLANVLTPDDVSSVTPVKAPHSEAVNATVTQDALLN